MNEDDQIQKSRMMAQKLSALYDEGLDFQEEQGTIYYELNTLSERYIDPVVIASGGMKMVSRVFDIKTGRHIAMAELRANAPKDLYEPFLREARLTALLEHPNIITVRDVGLLPDGRPFFTMDLKRGHSLSTYLKKRRSSRTQLLEIFVKLCDAISYAHSKTVLHLDLKPQNIQVGEFGEVFICDWGLSKIIDKRANEDEEFDEISFNPDLLNNMTLFGELKGTPGYMAPEQFKDHGIKSYQTDIYALGCLLYTLLTEEPPFRGSVQDIQEKTRKGQIVSPATAFPSKEIHSGLDAVVMKAMALKPSDRYESVTTLRDDVVNYLSGFSTVAEKASLLRELALFYKRNRAACLITLSALVSISVTIGVFINAQQVNIQETRAARDLAEIRRIEAEASFKQYRDELSRNMKLIRSLASNPEFQAVELSRVLIYSDPIRAVELAIERYQFLLSKGPNSNALSNIGYNYFMMQDFSRANEYFRQSASGNQDLYRLSRKYETLKTGELLTLEQLADLIRDLYPHRSGRQAMMEKLIACDSALRQEPADYSEVVCALLFGWNQHWTQGEFEYDSIDQSLKLSGDQLKVFARMLNYESSGQSPLRYLNIRSLDVRGTGLHDLNEIRTLRIEALDIRGTDIIDLKPISQFPLLKSLVLGSGQFTEFQLADLPRGLDLIVR